MTERVAMVLSSLILLGALIFAGLWYSGFQRIVHDKAVNADALQRLWAHADELPLNTVIPARNQWTPNAFVAEKRPGARPGKVSVLVLDDHYRGDDDSYRSQGGVIGDEISHGLLCSLPQKAGIKHVAIDPIVMRMITTSCAGRPSD
jgi:hypothetical protein